MPGTHRTGEAGYSSYGSKNNLIPDQENWFGPLVGQWDFEYSDARGTDKERNVKGEWIFSRVLDGMGVQDVFICPSRALRENNFQQDVEYGTTIRLYDPGQRTWDIFYGCVGTAFRLQAKKWERHRFDRAHAGENEMDVFGFDGGFVPLDKHRTTA